jgi:hypothetical protein
VAIVSRLAVGAEVAARRLVEVKLAGLKIERALYLLKARGRVGSAAAGVFVGMVRDAAAAKEGKR